MSGSLNRVHLIGNLGSDVDLKYTPNNRPVCTLSVATSEVWKDKSGARQERTDWHRVEVWGNTAEACAKYLSKGRSVYVEGRVQYDTYEKDGQKRYITKIVAEQVKFLGGGGGAGGERRGGGESQSRSQERREPSGGAAQDGGDSWGAGGSAPPPGDDDIPF